MWLMGRPSSTFLRELEAALKAELREEMSRRLGVALRVGVLRAAGHQASGIKERVGIDAGELRAADKLLKRAAVRLPTGERQPTAAAICRLSAQGTARRASARFRCGPNDPLLR